MSNSNTARRVGATQGLAPAARTASANSASVDLAGFQGVVVVFDVGVITDGTHTPKLQESNDNATWNDVAASNQTGALVNLASNIVQKVGYTGAKRFLRAVVTVAGATTGGVYGALILRGDPHQTPTP